MEKEKIYFVYQNENLLGSTEDFYSATVMCIKLGGNIIKDSEGNKWLKTN